MNTKDQIEPEEVDVASNERELKEANKIFKEFQAQSEDLKFGKAQVSMRLRVKV